MWGASQQANYRTICPEGKLLPTGHKPEVYALTYRVPAALPPYFTLSFLIQLLSSWSQDHECGFSIQLISTRSSMPSLFLLPWKILLFKKSPLWILLNSWPTATFWQDVLQHVTEHFL